MEYAWTIYSATSASVIQDGLAQLAKRTSTSVQANLAETTANASTRWMDTPVLASQATQANNVSIP